MSEFRKYLSEAKIDKQLMKNWDDVFAYFDESNVDVDEAIYDLEGAERKKAVKWVDQQGKVVIQLEDAFEKLIQFEQTKPKV